MKRINVGQILASKRERLGWSLRELEKKSGVIRRTIRRYENNKLPAKDTDALEQLIKTLFKGDYRVQNQLLKQVEDVSEMGAEIIRERATQRKELTSAAKRFYCQVHFVPINKFGEDFAGELRRKLKAKEAFPLYSTAEEYDSEVEYTGVKVFVDIIDKKSADHIRTIRISSDEGIETVDEDGNALFFEKEPLKFRIQKSVELCRRAKVTFNGILRLAYDEVVSTQLFTTIGKENVVIEKRLVENWLSSLRSAVTKGTQGVVLRSGPTRHDKSNKDKMIKSMLFNIRDVIGGLEFFSKQEKELSLGRSQLIHQLKEIYQQHNKSPLPIPTDE